MSTKSDEEIKTKVNENVIPKRNSEIYLSDNDEDLLEIPEIITCEQPIDEGNRSDDSMECPLLSDDDTNDRETPLDGDNEDHFKYLLSQWKLRDNVANTSMNRLLEALRSRTDLQFLPKDSRTLVQPPKKIEMKKIPGGHYHHFGIALTVQHALRSRTNLRENDVIKMQLNFDGLPVHKSDSTSLWPILGLLQNIKGETPFMIGVYYGQSKPLNVGDYLEDFINEYLLLSRDGLIVHGVRLEIELTTVVCDTPARAFIKRMKPHNGYSACDKCSTHGDYHNRRMTFPQLDAPLRTNDSFRTQEDEDHHIHGPSSPFLRTDIGKIYCCCVTF